MLTSDEILEQAARDGSIDISEWPRVLENVLLKLHNIVHNDFPIPKAPPLLTPPVLLPVAPVILPSNDDSTGATKSPEPSAPTVEPSDPPASTDKENAAPRPPVPAFAAVPRLRQQSPSSPLPPDLYTLYHYSRSTLETNFPNHPPYTIQRLAELVLYPKRYYRYLPPFLAALDRVVSVTSAVHEFPLAHISIDSASGFLANGEPSENHPEREGLGSDESLGGALLTPIPWLKRENGHHDFRSESSQTIEGPNGTGVIETVSVSSNGGSASPQDEDTMSHEQHLRAEGGVTQGELLRQEQEAGIVPVGQEVPRRSLMASGSLSAVGRGESTLAAEEEDGEKPEEHAHARGPEEIGAEDMGPQDTAIGLTRPLNMEAAAGRAKSPEVTRDDKDIEGNTTMEESTEGEKEESKTEEDKKEETTEQADEEMSDA
ncbi:hypothetical protein E4T47_03820 [Aureobasidium subglaciale]|nr:hypothetical protein E4T47_03820 [Aureobasidium subglaciale]